MNYGSLTFEKVDRSVFRNVDHAFNAMGKGGNMPCILNAANEVTVALFLEDKIGFTDIARLNGKAMDAISFHASPSLEDLYQTDTETREWVQGNYKQQHNRKKNNEVQQ